MVMESVEGITIIFDVVIAGASLWVLSKLVGYGGVIGDSLTKVGYGIVIIGFSQLIETIGLIIFSSDVSELHIFHRLLLTTGFIIVAWGFKKLMSEH